MTLHWLKPLALAGLAAAALPVIIHLLKRHRATRVPFPTLRFLTDSRAAAVKMRSLSDPWLLVLRVATIAAAVLAAAQPDLMTSWQRARVDRLLARAIVVDTSSSANAFDRQRQDAVAAERRADAVIELRTERVGNSLCHAATKLLEGPVARHEIVVIGDFQHGTINDAEIACVPQDVGLRFVQIGEGRAGTASVSLAGLAADGKVTEQRVEFEGLRTKVTLSEREAGEPAAEDPGNVHSRGSGRASPAGGRSGGHTGSAGQQADDVHLSRCADAGRNTAARPVDDRRGSCCAGRCGASPGCHLTPKCQGLDALTGVDSGRAFGDRRAADLSGRGRRPSARFGTG